MTTTDTAPLSALARPSGGLAMLAVDQREALRVMMAEQRDGAVSDDDVAAFKLAATRALTPHASAVLLDKQFVLDRALDEGAVAAGCGLIAAADRFVPSAQELGRDAVIDDDVDPTHYASRGAVAMKLLVIWRPDGDPGTRVDMVRRFVERCSGRRPALDHRARGPCPPLRWHVGLGRRGRWRRRASWARSARTCTRPRCRCTARARTTSCSPAAARSATPWRRPGSCCRPVSTTRTSLAPCAWRCAPARPGSSPVEPSGVRAWRLTTWSGRWSRTPSSGCSGSAAVVDEERPGECRSSLGSPWSAPLDRRSSSTPPAACSTAPGRWSPSWRAEVGAEVVGPRDLVMTPEDVESAAAVVGTDARADDQRLRVVLRRHTGAAPVHGAGAAGAAVVVPRARPGR